MEGPLLDKKQRTFLHFLQIYIKSASVCGFEGTFDVAQKIRTPHPVAT